MQRAYFRVKKRCELGYCDGSDVHMGGAGSDNSMVKSGEMEEKAPEGKSQPRKGVKCEESAADDGFRADGEDCSRCYQCASGKWVSKECPTGTIFNSMIGVCDWPANVPGC